MKWLSKRLKSKTIWLTSIAPSILAFMVMYESSLQDMLKDYYQYVFMFFAALAWKTREMTNSSLEDK